MGIFWGNNLLIREIVYTFVMGACSKIRLSPQNRTNLSQNRTNLSLNRTNLSLNRTNATVGQYMPSSPGETVIGTIQTSFTTREPWFSKNETINMQAYIKLLEAAVKKYPGNIDVRDVWVTGKTIDGINVEVVATGMVIRPNVEFRLIHSYLFTTKSKKSKKEGKKSNLTLKTYSTYSTSRLNLKLEVRPISLDRDGK